MTCGVCLEVCPNVTENNKFVGAQAISQVRLFNLHPTGSMTKDERLNALMVLVAYSSVGIHKTVLMLALKVFH